MFDPYAATLASVQLAEGVNVVPPKKAAGLPSNPPAMMGCLVSLVEEFDFGSSKRCSPRLLVQCSRENQPPELCQVKLTCINMQWNLLILISIFSRQARHLSGDLPCAGG